MYILLVGDTFIKREDLDLINQLNTDLFVSIPNQEYLRTHIRLSPILRGLARGFVNDKKVYTQLAAASYKVDCPLSMGLSGFPHH